MKHNAGSIDRGIRGLVGVALLILFLVAPPANIYLHFGVVAAGIILLATAVLSWCPLYTVLGLNTCATKTEE